MLLPGLLIVLLLVLLVAPLAYEFFRTDDLFSPLGFIGLFSLMYFVGPGLHYVVMSPSLRSTLLLGNNNLWYIVPGVVVSVIGIWSLLAGWRWGKRRVRIRTGLTPANLDYRRLRTARYVFGFIGLVGLALFIGFTGGIPSSLAELSSKRNSPTEYIRWLTEFLLLASLLTWISYCRFNRTLWSPRLMFPLTWLVLAVFPWFYASNRGKMLLIIVAHLVIVHYLQRPLNLKKILPLAPFGITAVGLMLWFRQQSRKGYSEIELDGFALVFDSLKATFGADYGTLTAISHLVHAVPSEVSYRFGSTLLKWMVFPIPRPLWPDKPVNLGQVVVAEIYPHRNNGTPPTLIGELYLNFDLVGVVIGMVIMGLLLRIIYEHLVLEQDSNPMLISIYVVIMISGFGLTDITMMMTTLLRWVIPMLVVAVVVNSSQPEQTGVPG